MTDTTANFPSACEVVITNRASQYFGMRGFVCGRDIAAQTIQLALIDGPVKTCATECVARTNGRAR